MIKFSSFSSDSFLGNFLRWFLKKILPRGIPLFILQGSLRGKRWISGAGDNNGFLLGSYEHETQGVLKAHIHQGDIFYDIGANVGFFTLFASFLVGERGEVVAFEPVSGNVEIIQRHLCLNRVANVIIFKAAVADQEGIMSFKSGVNTAEGRLAPHGDQEVQVLALDPLVMNHKIRAPQIMKIDVEGAELMVLEGARKIIQTFRPKIILSTHGESLHHQCISWLKDVGYHLEPIPRNMVLGEARSALAV